MTQFFQKSIRNRHLAEACANLIGHLRGMLASAQTTFVRFFIHPQRGSQGEVKNILIVKLDELGDVAMALPFITALREGLPHAKTTILLNASVVGLLDSTTDMSVLGVDIRCNSFLRPLILPIRHYLFVRKHLRSQQFDVCFLPRRDADDVCATILAYFTNSRRIVSFSEKCTPRKAIINKTYDTLLTDVLPSPPLQHETVSNLSLMHSIGLATVSLKPRLPTTVAAQTFAEKCLPKSAAESYIAICPTSGHSKLKQWGPDRFAEVGVQLVSSGFILVLLGAPSDAALGSVIETAAQGRCVNLIGKTTLPQMAAVLSRCVAYIGNDAGPMHVASALGMSTIGIFGPSCHHRFGPWGAGASLLVREIACSPCSVHTGMDRCKVCIHSETLCLRQIHSRDVVDQVLVSIKAQQT